MVVANLLIRRFKYLHVASFYYNSNLNGCV